MSGAPERLRLTALFWVLAGALLLCAPAIANGFPFLFFDTLHYYAGGEKIITLLGEKIGLAQALGEGAPAVSGASLPATPFPAALSPPALSPPTLLPSDPESGRGLMSYMGGRSPYYSAVLYLLAQMIGAWGPAFAQALAGSWLVFLACKALNLSRPTFGAVMAAMSAFSVLPWMATYLMPDVFGGYAILAATLLIFYRAAFSRAERLALIAFLVAATSFHTINLLLMVVAMGLVAVVLWSARTTRAQILQALGPLAIAAGAALLATMAYPIGAKIALGKPLPQPPFLMARVLADGPGRAYLREACAAGAELTLCRFKDFALDNGDVILWSLDPKQGVYRASSWDVQQALIGEQTRFVIGVITHKPLEQIGASTQNWLRQMFFFGARDLLTGPEGWRAAAQAGAVDDVLAPFLATPAGNGRMPLALFTHLHTLALALAGLILAWRLSRPAMRAHADGRAFIAATLFVVALIVINAAIAGALSGVFARYQARVIWLIVLLALACAAPLSPWERTRAPGSPGPDGR